MARETRYRLEQLGPEEEKELLDALRAGDEDAFAALIDAYSPVLLRMAMTYVSTRAVAEEVVQETWLGVLRGLDRFEGRSSLKTWIFRILANRAKTRGKREKRVIPFSSAVDEEEGPVIDPERFFGRDHAEYPGHWALGPTPWGAPEKELLSGEMRKVILQAIERLPERQRQVVTLRDVEGWSSEEVRNVLAISETNQRVLLHRARAKVRSALELYFGAVEPTT
jgi:RNA polymerase sigma-70 factor, ECF subfamily